MEPYLVAVVNSFLLVFFFFSCVIHLLILRFFVDTYIFVTSLHWLTDVTCLNKSLTWLIYHDFVLFTPFVEAQFHCEDELSILSPKRFVLYFYSSYVII